MGNEKLRVRPLRVDELVLKMFYFLVNVWAIQYCMYLYIHISFGREVEVGPFRIGTILN